MRGSELIDCDVYDADGKRLGAVHDLRFDLKWTRAHQLTCRLTGLECRDSSALGHRLGYGTGDMAGPWPLGMFFTRSRARKSLTVEWRDVVSVEPGRIRLKRRVGELRGESS